MLYWSRDRAALPVSGLLLARFADARNDAGGKEPVASLKNNHLTGALLDWLCTISFIPASLRAVADGAAIHA